MKRLIHLLIAGIILISFSGLILSGCALKPIEAPVTSVFSDLAKGLKKQKEITSPLKLSALPQAEQVNFNGIDYLGFSKEGASALLVFRTSAQANTDIAWELTAAIKEMQLVQDNMLMLGKVTEQRANYLAFKWSVAETELSEEKRNHQFDNAMHRILIIILALVGL